jgi:predicted nucleic acid-binding protein
LIVLDASAAIELVLRTPKADRIAARTLDPTERLHAPHLIDIELTQVLRRLVQAREITAARADVAFEDYAELVIERHPHRPLLPRVWSLRSVMSAYDGAYVALAEALAAPLLTCDEKLSRAHGHGAQIELIAATS